MPETRNGFSAEGRKPALLGRESCNLRYKTNLHGSAEATDCQKAISLLSSEVLSVLSISLPICRQAVSTLVYWCPPLF